MMRNIFLGNYKTFYIAIKYLESINIFIINNYLVTIDVCMIYMIQDVRIVLVVLIPRVTTFKFLANVCNILTACQTAKCISNEN